VQFTKAYDGTAGWDHAVAYSGTLHPDGDEIEGQWLVESTAGRFLMMRSRGVSESVVRRAFARV
jgi:hypothetical protein